MIQLNSKTSVTEKKSEYKHFFQEDIQMADSYMKKCSVSLIIREICS